MTLNIKVRFLPFFSRLIPNDSVRYAIAAIHRNAKNFARTFNHAHRHISTWLHGKGPTEYQIFITVDLPIAENLAFMLLLLLRKSGIAQDRYVSTYTSDRIFISIKALSI